MLYPSHLRLALFDKMIEILFGLRKTLSEIAMKAKQEYSTCGKDY